VSKLLFKPIGIVAGILAGLASRKLFRGLWKIVDDEQPPKPDERSALVGKLALALVLEGAVFRLVKGLAEHGSRQAFSRLTGSWPGAAARRED
jgi:Protein of unknown function (DUF4235)